MFDARDSPKNKPFACTCAVHSARCTSNGDGMKTAGRGGPLLTLLHPLRKGCVGTEEHERAPPRDDGRRRGRSLLFHDKRRVIDMLQNREVHPTVVGNWLTDRPYVYRWPTLWGPSP